MRRLWLLVLLAGCAPLAGSGRATVLPAGHNEVTLAPEATLLGTKLTAEGITLPSLQMTLGYHRGVADRFELGARLWGFSVERAGLESWGAALDGKLQLRFHHDTGSGPDISVAPSVGYHQLSLGGTPEHGALVSLPVLVGLRMGARNQLVLGPRVAWLAWWGESQRAQRHLFYGTSVAFAWSLSQRWTLIPELVWLWSPIRFSGESSDDQLSGVNVLALGLNIGFGW